MAALAAVACAVTALLFPDTALAAAKKAAVAASTDPLWKRAISFVLHLDKHLVSIFANYGFAAYGMLFAIVFCETGLVVTPFLPGDSLLFACGALGAQGIMNAPLVLGLLFLAAVMGDTVNYGIGNFIGGKVIQKYPKIFKKQYIDKTKGFYEKYGGKTVVLARFFPIIRTFAPFVAGVANMNYTKFFTFNVVGAAVWVGLFIFLGYFFGTIPAVQENFAATIVAIILLSCLPVVFELIRRRRRRRRRLPRLPGGVEPPLLDSDFALYQLVICIRVFSQPHSPTCASSSHFFSRSTASTSTVSSSPHSSPSPVISKRGDSSSTMSPSESTRSIASPFFGDRTGGSAWSK